MPICTTQSRDLRNRETSLPFLSYPMDREANKRVSGLTAVSTVLY